MPKTKKFIDRKNAVTFNLVHRSQKDPLIADEDAPQRVLVPVNATVPVKKDKDQQKLTLDQRKEVQMKYGIFYDDDYNYLQHLKDTREVCMVAVPKSEHKRTQKIKEQAAVNTELVDKFNLPSDVFASNEEEAVGMLNKAAPQGLRLDLDPDVVAALDEDFDFDNPDNELEDNFMELAMGEGDGESDLSDSEGEDGDMSDDSNEVNVSSNDERYDSDDEMQDRVGRLRTWSGEETKSRFSQYSMSSSVMKRNQGLTLLDDRFEKMYADYDDTELGALDCEDIEGFLPDNNEMLLKAAQEFEDNRRKLMLDKARELDRIKKLAEIAEENSSSEELTDIEVNPQEKWDCETILSTYSNLYNHPKLISEPKPDKIKIHKKTGIPMVLGKEDNRLTMKTLAKFNSLQNGSSDSCQDDDARTVMSTLSVLSLRPKDETPEEKKDRKRLLKEYRKERRVEKKANKEAFKEEKKRQEKIMMNNRNNVQGNRIL